MEIALLILKIIGSLALFIYGMKVMSEGVQRVAGVRLRNILRTITDNRLKGVATGLSTTAIIQSSSATTVMTVSFVNAGLLNLREAIGVIIGANIGTTVTAWLIAIFAFGGISVFSLILPLMAIGLPLMFLRRANFKYSGEIIVGFALLFLGLDLLKTNMPDLQDFPETFAFIAHLVEPGILMNAIFVLVGIVITALIQSSSAAVALTLTLVAGGIIGLDTAAAMVLGENIGTTITANLAAIVGNTQAKRAARAHFLFNGLGVLWFFPITPFIVDGLSWLLAPVTSLTVDIGVQGVGNKEIIIISAFHSGFNILNSILFIPAISVLEKLAIAMVPAKGDQETFTLEYIGRGPLATPELSILEAYKETAKFGRITWKMSGFVKRLLEENDEVVREELAKRIRKYEDITDRIEVEIANFLAKVNQEEISDGTSIKVRGLLSIAGELERIGDILFQMSLTLQSKYDQKVYFLPRQRESLKALFDKVDEAFSVMYGNLSSTVETIDLEPARKIEEEINALRNELRNRHLTDISKGKYSPQSGMIYNDVFSSLEKIGDHIINVSEAAAGKV